MEQILALLTANSTSNYIGNFASCEEKVDQNEVCWKLIALHYMITFSKSWFLINEGILKIMLYS